MTRARIAVFVLLWNVHGITPDAFTASALTRERIQAASWHERAVLVNRPGESLHGADTRLGRCRSLPWQPLPLVEPPSRQAAFDAGSASFCEATGDRARRLFLVVGPTSPRAPPASPPV